MAANDDESDKANKLSVQSKVTKSPKSTAKKSPEQNKKVMYIWLDFQMLNVLRYLLLFCS